MKREGMTLGASELLRAADAFDVIGLSEETLMLLVHSGTFSVLEKSEGRHFVRAELECMFPKGEGG